MFGSVLSRRRLRTYETTKRLFESPRSCLIEAVAPSGEFVVIKCYAQDRKNRDFVQSIRREAHLLRELNHPHIVKSLASWSDERFFYIVLEHCAEGDLLNVAARFPAFCVPEDVLGPKILRPLLLALSFLHARAILHRDVKPENVVVTSDGCCKLCDFGFALDAKLEVPVSRIGTLEFMAPELACLPREAREARDALRRAGVPLYGPKVDVWAAGCVAFELLIGAPLFTREKEDPGALERTIVSADPVQVPSRTRAGAAVSAEAAAFLRGALEKEERTRPMVDELLRGPWMEGAAAEAAEAAEASAAAAAAAVAAAGAGGEAANGVRGKDLPSSPTTVLDDPFAAAGDEGDPIGEAAASAPCGCAATGASGGGFLAAVSRGSSECSDAEDAGCSSAAAASASSQSLGPLSSPSSRISLAGLADASGGVLLMDQEEEKEVQEGRASQGLELPDDRALEEVSGVVPGAEPAAAGGSSGQDAPPPQRRGRAGQTQLLRVVSASVLEVCSKRGTPVAPQQLPPSPQQAHQGSSGPAGGAGDGGTACEAPWAGAGEGGGWPRGGLSRAAAPPMPVPLSPQPGQPQRAAGDASCSRAVAARAAAPGHAEPRPNALWMLGLPALAPSAPQPSGESSGPTPSLSPPPELQLQPQEDRGGWPHPALSIGGVVLTHIGAASSHVLSWLRSPLPAALLCQTPAEEHRSAAEPR